MPSDFAMLIGKRLGGKSNGAGKAAGPMLNPSDDDSYGDAPAGAAGTDKDTKDADAMEASAASDLVDAIHAKDKATVRAALKDFIEVCLEQQDYGAKEADDDEGQEGT